MQTFNESVILAKQKMLNNLNPAAWFLIHTREN
jgi:hypothetical protein